MLFLIMKWADSKGCIDERNLINSGLITLKRKKIGHKTGVTNGTMRFEFSLAAGC